MTKRPLGGKKVLIPWDVCLEMELLGQVVLFSDRRK